MRDPLVVVAHPKRRRILEALAPAPTSVGELARRAGFDQVTTSRHLRVLRDARMVSSRADRQRRIYSIGPAGLDALRAWHAAHGRPSRSNARS